MNYPMTGIGEKDLPSVIGELPSLEVSKNGSTLSHHPFKFNGIFPYKPSMLGYPLVINLV